MCARRFNISTFRHPSRTQAQCEISQIIVLEKPRMLSLLGKAVLASHVRRKLKRQYDRAPLEFLRLYANRLRRWMEQSINALRNAFNAFADMYRVHFEAAPVEAGLSEESAIQNDLQILCEWSAQDTLDRRQAEAPSLNFSKVS